MSGEPRNLRVRQETVTCKAYLKTTIQKQNQKIVHSFLERNDKESLKTKWHPS